MYIHIKREKSSMLCRRTERMIKKIFQPIKGIILTYILHRSNSISWCQCNQPNITLKTKTKKLDTTLNVSAYTSLSKVYASSDYSSHTQKTVSSTILPLEGLVIKKKKKKEKKIHTGTCII